MRGLLKEKCPHCKTGNLYLDLYEDKDGIPKCIMCGRVDNQEVPDFILKEVKHWKKKGAHKKVKDLR